MEKKWYALRIYSGQENKVKSLLENEIRLAQLEDRFGEVIVPQENVVEMRDGKKRAKSKTFFPGYVLIEMILDKETIHLVQNTPGVLSFMGEKNKPQPLHSEEMTRIMHKMEEHKQGHMTTIPFRIGDAIKVTDGPFNEFTGFIEEVNLEKNKVKVMVSIFGRATPVELDFMQVQLEK